VAVILAAAVLAAVHHAEVVALWVGEPFGSLVLAVAVTVIEVALIVILMVSGTPQRPYGFFGRGAAGHRLAGRPTVLAAVRGSHLPDLGTAAWRGSAR
jgi:hypothetical protein